MIFLIAMVFELLPVIGCWVASLEIQMVLPLFLLSVLFIGLPLFGLDQWDSTPIGLFCFYSVNPAQMDLLTAGCSYSLLFSCSNGWSWCTTTGTSNYSTSRRFTTIVIEALKENTRFDIGAYHAFYSVTQGDIRKEKDILFEVVFSDIVSQLSVPQQWAIVRAKDEKMSLWLTVSPLAKHHFWPFCNWVSWCSGSSL